MEPNGEMHSPRVSELLIAVVDGLRKAHDLLRALVHEDEEAVVGHADTTEVLVYGPRVADALEGIARRLESEGD